MTLAQESKAKRYMDRGLVHRVGRVTAAVWWGQPSATVETWRLDPLPGCKAGNQVTVTERNAGDGALLDVSYKCSCQRADDAVGGSDLCSHAMAVHLARKAR